MKEVAAKGPGAGLVHKPVYWRHILGSTHLTEAPTSGRGTEWCGHAETGNG